MNDNRRAGRPYLWFFAAVCVLFIGILAVTYRLARRAHPVMLDEHGKVTETR
jgi:hypothetical protein